MRKWRASFIVCDASTYSRQGSDSSGTHAWSKGSAVADNYQERDGLVCLMDLSNFSHWDPIWDQLLNKFFNTSSIFRFLSKLFGKWQLSSWVSVHE